MPERQFRIESGKVWSGDDEASLSMKIIEVKSGELVAAIRLTASQAFDFLTGGSVSVTGIQSPNLDRIGKTMQNASIPVPGYIKYPMTKDQQLAAAEEAAREASPGWEVYETRMSNTGPVVIGRKWVDSDGIADH